MKTTTVKKNKNKYTREQWTSEMLRYEMLKNEYLEARKQATVQDSDFETSFFEDNTQIIKQEKLTVIALKIKILVFLAAAFLSVAGFEMSQHLTVIYGAWSAGISLSLLALINIFQWLKIRLSNS